MGTRVPKETSRRLHFSATLQIKGVTTFPRNYKCLYSMSFPNSEDQVHCNKGLFVKASLLLKNLSSESSAEGIFPRRAVLLFSYFWEKTLGLPAESAFL